MPACSGKCRGTRKGKKGDVEEKKHRLKDSNRNFVPNFIQAKSGREKKKTRTRVACLQGKDTIRLNL